MTITPDQARELLDGATPGPWWIHPAYGTVEPDVISGEGCRFVATDEDLNLSAKAPGMAQTIAGMRWEYAVEHEHSPGNWHQVTEWGPEENPYQPGYGPGDDERIVRRLVGPVEVMEP